MSEDTGFVDVEREELLAVVAAQANAAKRAEVQVKKLSIALSRLIAMESSQKQVNLLTKCLSYVT
jgi:hypothetical protein